MSTSLTQIKWISATKPVIIINRNMERLYLTKVELKALQTEIDEFIAFYSDSFTDESINLSTDDSDKQYDMWHGLQDGPDDNGES